MKILNYKKKVKEIMEQYPETRDNGWVLAFVADAPLTTNYY